MLYSYIKTAIRSIVKNKLFSAINIIGLSISMSVGLLMIAFMSDLFSYDRFHENAKTIYRVTTTRFNNDGSQMNFASTSVNAGKQIKELVSGVSDVVIMRRGFSGYAAIGESTMPVRGFWATENFFKMFTFPLIHGDAATALAEPFSLVLTEKAALRLFGDTNVSGKLIKIDTSNYLITGVMKDVPKFSHMKFEALISFSTVEIIKPAADGGFLSWESTFQNYVYTTIQEGTGVASVQSSLNKICDKENAALDKKKIHLSLQPLLAIALGENLVNPIGQTIPKIAVWILGGLSLVVLVSACFNFTNLSIARMLRRSREVGIRKVIGAQKSHVIRQYLFESVVTSLLALIFAFLLFLLIRPEFLVLTPFLNELIALDLSISTTFYFIILAVVVGMVAGALPALLLARISPIQILDGISSIKVYRNITIRKVLIVSQYMFSLLFITITIIGYKQYKHLLTADTGFRIENILNIRVPQDKIDAFQNALQEIAEIQGISRSLMVNGVASFTVTTIKYNDPLDSARVFYNSVSTDYIPNHDYTIIAGRNFSSATGALDRGLVVNEQLLKRFNIAGGDPRKAIGEILIMNKEETPIIGVLKDFHHGTMESRIESFIFRHAISGLGLLNVRVISSNWSATIAKIEKTWLAIDNTTPLQATLYTDEIKSSYQPYSIMLKLIGFLAFVTTSIASMGLFGMVVFGTDSRIKEMSIRKVMGASERNLIYLLSRNFLALILFASILAIPAAYIFFDKVVFSNIAYHAMLGPLELFIGLAFVLVVALLMIGSQTIRVARSNPGDVLRKE
jgi:putative ABC transport system permease protein